MNRSSLRLPALVFATFATLTAACGDDASTSGSGGAGGDGTTSSTTATVSSSSSAASSSTSQGTTTGGDGGQGGGTTTGEGGGGGVGGTGGSGDGGSGGTGGGDAASFDTAWTLLVGPDTVDCFFLGGEWVDVQFQREGEDAVVERYDCHDGADTSAPLPAGDYVVQATLLDFEEEVILGSEPVEVTLGEGGASVDLELAAPGARLAVSWSVLVDGVEATCLEAGASHAEIGLSNVENGLGFGESIECPLGEGTTRYFPLGTYDLSVNLIDFDVIVAEGIFTELVLDEADETRVVPEVIFDVDP